MLSVTICSCGSCYTCFWLAGASDMKKPARGGPKPFFPEPTSAKLLSISLFYGSLI